MKKTSAGAGLHPLKRAYLRVYVNPSVLYINIMKMTHNQPVCAGMFDMI